MDDCAENVHDPTSKDGVIGVVHVNHVKGYVFYFAIVLIAYGTRREILLIALTCFPPKPYRGLSASCRRFLSSFMLSNVDTNKMSAELLVSMRIFVIVHPATFVLMTIATV